MEHAATEREHEERAHPNGISGEFQGAVAAEIVLLHDDVDGGAAGCRHNDQGVFREMNTVTLAQSDNTCADETDENANPSRNTKAFLEREGGEQGCPDRCRSNQQAGGSGGDFGFAVVQGNVVESDTEEASHSDSREIAALGQAKVAERGVNGEHNGCDHEAQNGQVRGRVALQTDTDSCEG